MSGTVTIGLRFSVPYNWATSGWAATIAMYVSTDVSSDGARDADEFRPWYAVWIRAGH